MESFDITTGPTRDRKATPLFVIFSSETHVHMCTQPAHWYLMDFQGCRPNRHMFVRLVLVDSAKSAMAMLCQVTRFRVRIPAVHTSDLARLVTAFLKPIVSAI